MLDTPVLLLVFNRPDTTLRVFETIRQVKPKRLFIAGDGPRAARPDDAPRVARVRETVSRVDWDCEVKTLFREENLGCGRAVSGAITWFFNQVERGIVLEDDTLPSPSFFTFCETLLAHYQNDERVMHIGGTSVLGRKRFAPHSYYFSRYPAIWGWASWARAWQHYRLQWHDALAVDALLASAGLGFTEKERAYWKQCFAEISANPNHTWDYQWHFTLWQRQGICVTPNTNLITNIGFGADGTHTLNADWDIANLPRFEIPFPLKHPDGITIHRKNDLRTFTKVNDVPTTFANKLRNLSYKIIPYEKRKRYFGI
jgi:hypothetical protein